MKYLKYLLVGGIIALFILATSSYTAKTSRLSEGIYPGNLIPDFELTNESGNVFKLSDMKGQKVLVNLWAAYDAESHMRNVQLWNALQKEDHQIKMISISFDQSKSIFEKTLDIDGIDSKSQYVETSGNKSKIYQNFKLDRGFKNYLIDENGVIIEKNIAPNDLYKVLAKN